MSKGASLISINKMNEFSTLVAKICVAAACGAPLLFLSGGCGGGGGGGSSPNPTGTPRATATARPIATPVAGARRLIVQLRDASDGVVEGIVSVGTVSLATQGGEATFSPVASGNVRVSVEVNGVTTEATATVAASGPTTFVVRVASGVTPVPTGTLPAPPF
jgi:hypothetical protein